MCLSCANIGANGKVQISKLLNGLRSKVYLRTYDNRNIKLNNKQIDEIIENAVVVIATGVDFSTDIWAIQWDRNYKVKHVL